MFQGFRNAALLGLLHATLFVAAGSPPTSYVEPRDETYTHYVDPFHGTERGGNRFPGVVAAPFAMVKLGPDVVSGKTDAYSGFLSDGKITGFSMMHESGTGGAPKYGVVSQMPVPGVVENPLADLSQSRKFEDKSQVGFYRSTLANDIVVTLTADERFGHFTYQFPDLPASVVIDVSHVLTSWRGLGWEQHYSGGEFSYFSDGHYEGKGTYNNGWNLSPDWSIYFCGYFDSKPTSSKTFSGSEDKTQYDTTSSVKSSSESQRIGGVFTFSDKDVRSAVGISFISTARACEFYNQDFFDIVDTENILKKRAEQKWDAALSRIHVDTSTNEDDLYLLYSAMYGMFLLPSKRTGENPGWDDEEPYYDDIVTLWDTHRSHTPLFHILQPVAYEEFIRSLINIFQHDGYMPDARSSNFNGRVQGGSSADNVLADAYVKGVRGDVDWEAGFKAMVQNAERVPPNNDDPTAPDSSTKEGRGALPDWLKYNYITPNFSRAVSRAVEYSANDFALYQVASGLEKADDVIDKYFLRSTNWRNHWNPCASGDGHNGFVAPRNADGSFVEIDPLDCGKCYWKDAYYEDIPWVYSMNAIHDIEAVKVYIQGGDEAFADRIDKLFDPERFDYANEPGFTIPFLYNFLHKQQYRSVERSRQIMKKYNHSPQGLPGNSDAGAMESNLLWQLIGLWPLTGQTTFLILSPWFSSLTIDLGDDKIDKKLVITSTGGDKDTFYVQSLKVNGQQWDKSWVTWDDIFANGGTMEFVLGSDKVGWDTGALPPSPASYDRLACKRVNIQESLAPKCR